MAEKLTFDIEVNGNQDQALGSLKAQLREATAEVQALSEKFGATSVQAINAAKKAAELKDRIGDAKALTDAFNPDAKFKALTASLSGVAGGFAAAQGAIALFGVQSEAVEKTLLKVQSAMAISEGLQNVGESIDSFKQLGAVIKSSTAFQLAYNFVMGQKVAIQTQDTATTIASTVATKAQAAATNTATVATTASSVALKVLRGAILATGIGALIIGLIAVFQNFGKIKAAILNAIPGLGKFASTVGNVINAFTDLVGITNAASRAEQQRQAIFAKSSANTKVVNEGIERQIKLIQAQGAEQGKVDALRKQQINNELKDLRNAVDEKGLLYNEQSKRYKDLQNDLQVIDAIAKKTQEDEAKKANEKQTKADNKYATSSKKSAQDIAKEKKEAEKEAQLVLAEANKKLKTDQEQELLNITEAYAEKKKKLELAGVKDNGDLAAAEQKERKAVLDKFDKEAKELKDKNEKDAKDKEAAFQKELNKITLETKLEGIVDENAKAREQLLTSYEQQRKDIDANENLTAEQKSALKIALATKETQALAALKLTEDKKNAAQEISDLDKRIAKNTADLEIERNLLKEKDILLKDAYAKKLITEEQFTAGIDANAKARTEIDKQETEAKVRNAEIASQLLNTIADVLGKNTAAGKAAAIASTTIDTYLSAQKAYASQLIPGDPTSPIRAAIAAGIAVVGGLKNVKSILAVKTPGGGGGGSVPSISAAAPIAPPQPQAQTTTLDNRSINAIGNQTTRAYVVESDVTGSQQRMAAIQQRARFG